MECDTAEVAPVCGIACAFGCYAVANEILDDFFFDASSKHSSKRKISLRLSQNNKVWSQSQILFPSLQILL